MNYRPRRRCLFRKGKPGGRLFSAHGHYCSASHQLVVLAAALALVGGLYVLPKGIVKPKESRSELNRMLPKRPTATAADPIPTAPKPRLPRAGTGTAIDNGGAHSDDDGHDHSASAPAGRAAHHRQPRPTAELARVAGAIQGGAQRRGSVGDVAITLARRYESVERFDSAGYYYEQVALASPGAQNWQRAADAYFQAFSFAAIGGAGQNCSAVSPGSCTRRC